MIDHLTSRNCGAKRYLGDKCTLPDTHEHIDSDSQAKQQEEIIMSIDATDIDLSNGVAGHKKR